MIAFLCLGPGLIWLSRRARWAPAAFALGSIAAAEIGRRRDGGRAMFPATTSLFAPFWLVERAVTSWIALGSRVFRGGVPYRGRVLRRSATSMRRLRDRRESAPLRVIRHTAASSETGHSDTAARSHAGS
jgi:hypothetical protein